MCYCMVNIFLFFVSINNYLKPQLSTLFPCNKLAHTYL